VTAWARLNLPPHEQKIFLIFSSPHLFRHTKGWQSVARFISNTVLIWAFCNVYKPESILQFCTGSVAFTCTDHDTRRRYEELVCPSSSGTSFVIHRDSYWILSLSLIKFSRFCAKQQLSRDEQECLMLQYWEILLSDSAFVILTYSDSQNISEMDFRIAKAISFIITWWL
jgi:hypothetical protein